jgi:Xaa-Pro dipeptidase
MDQEIIGKLQSIAKARGWPSLLLLSPENVTYAIGFVVPSQVIMRWRHAVVIVPADGKPSVFCVDMEASTLQDRLPEIELFTFNEFTDQAMEVLARALKSLGLEDSTLGIERDYLSTRDMATLQKAAPTIRWESCEDDVAQARVIKTQHEIDLIRQLSYLTDDAIYAALKATRAGDTEMQVGGRLTAGLFERGADKLGVMVVASGDRSGFPNVGPSMRRLQSGDLLRTEIFGVKDGYLAGVCRTSIVGQPDAEMERVWKVLVECRHLLMERIKPGASAAAIYREFLDRFTTAGLKPINFAGHGIGVHFHEEPYIGRYGDATLQEGMVLGVEPLVYTPGRGMQLKDIVLVTVDGCELLSNASPADDLIEIPV